MFIYNKGKYYSKEISFVDNGTHTGSVTYGGSLTADTWSFKVEELEGYASTTKNSCIPIGETWFGRKERGMVNIVLITLSEPTTKSELSHSLHFYNIFIHELYLFRVRDSERWLLQRYHRD